MLSKGIMTIWFKYKILNRLQGCRRLKLNKIIQNTAFGWQTKVVEFPIHFYLYSLQSQAILLNIHFQTLVDRSVSSATSHIPSIQRTICEAYYYFSIASHRFRVPQLVRDCIFRQHDNKNFARQNMYTEAATKMHFMDSLYTLFESHSFSASLSSTHKYV